LQPKPHTASGYCYSDRLHSRSYDLYLQPRAFRFCLLQQNLPAVLFSRRSRISGTKWHSGADAHLPKAMASVSDYSGPKPFLF
jgi:hypothetical protein